MSYRTNFRCNRFLPGWYSSLLFLAWIWNYRHKCTSTLLSIPGAAVMPLYIWSCCIKQTFNKTMQWFYNPTLMAFQIISVFKAHNKGQLGSFSTTSLRILQRRWKSETISSLLPWKIEFSLAMKWTSLNIFKRSLQCILGKTSNATRNSSVFYSLNKEFRRNFQW